ncbi:MAG: RnfH family protein [Legionellales bacterium]|nr:RnfH family protein [Legionellales bacterium]|tara:strand:- start:2 stop:286 length:285 start_codon:yes stop_codon:yes gene_type:complete
MADIQVQVVYALPEQQESVTLLLPAKSTVKMAILKSGLLEKYPTLDLETLSVGIFSKKVKFDDILKHEDRVEIYRNLLIDPKQARLKRTGRKKT